MGNESIKPIPTGLSVLLTNARLDFCLRNMVGLKTEYGQNEAFVVVVGLLF
jgi:hypothetical protein